LMTAILTLNTIRWPTVQARTGDVLELSVRSVNPAAPADIATAGPPLPTTYTVTEEKVQTIWFPHD